MSLDVLGPASTNAVTGRPVRTIVRGTNDTWFKDCSSPSAADGTQLGADWFNDMLAQLRTAFDSADIVEDNADDMLWRAMQSVGIRGAVDTGAANAMVCAFTPPVLALSPFLALAVKAGHTNTGAVTLTSNATTTKPVKWPDGSDLAAGAWPVGAIGFVMVDADGSKYQLLSRPQLPSSSFWQPGQIIMWPTNTPPAGALECNGASVAAATYPNLFAAIGYQYGGASGVFNLPDYRGMFMRGWDHGAGVDPDRSSRTTRGDGTVGDNVGTRQSSENLSHNHAGGTLSVTPATFTADGIPPSAQFEFGIVTGMPGGAGGMGAGDGFLGSAELSPLSDFTVTTGTDGGAETRPINVGIMFCIAY